MKKPTISIYTPSHKPDYLLPLYESMKDQDFLEWVIVLNGNGSVPESITSDSRVRVFTFDSNFVGALKSFAVDQCMGDVFLEVDHDDLLVPNTIYELEKAVIENPDCGFFYSNFANFEGDFEPTPRYDLACGWEYRQFEFNGHVLDEAVAFPPDPVSCSLIWYAPNHLRAWTRNAYVLSGGYDIEMRVLDDQDLISRTYAVTKFFHIDKCLYLYRIMGSNTWLEFNEEIQTNVIPIHWKYIRDMVKVNCSRIGLKYLELSQEQETLQGKWPYPENSAGAIVADDLLQRLQNPILAMSEAYRVLEHGGSFILTVPSTDGRGAFQDPRHVSFWNENSFWYYTKQYLAELIGFKGRFQTVSLETYFPTTWHEENKIPYVRAHLVARKLSTRLAGKTEI